MMCRFSPGPERMASTAAREPQITPIRFTSHLKPHVVVRLLPGLRRSHHAGVVHPHLERPALGSGRGGRAVRLRIAHVELHREARRPRPPWRPRPRRRRPWRGRCSRGPRGRARFRGRSRAPHRSRPRPQASGRRAYQGWLASQYASRMAIAEANGQQLYYEIHGEGEPLLCVHGLSCDTLAWIPQIQAFAAEHRTVIFDNRDVGQSSMAEPGYDIADMARDALALADELELESFHLLGVSMGGAIAQEIALQAPGACPDAHARRHVLDRRHVLPQARRGLGRAREADQPRAARRRADAVEPLGGVLREPGHGRVRPHGDAAEPAPAAARGLLPPARRMQLPRHARPAGLAHDADAGDRRGARHPRTDLEVQGDRRRRSRTRS